MDPIYWTLNFEQHFEDIPSLVVFYMTESEISPFQSNSLHWINELGLIKSKIYTIKHSLSTERRNRNTSLVIADGECMTKISFLFFFSLFFPWEDFEESALSHTWDPFRESPYGRISSIHLPFQYNHPNDIWDVWNNTVSQDKAFQKRPSFFVYYQYRHLSAHKKTQKISIDYAPAQYIQDSAGHQGLQSRMQVMIIAVPVFCCGLL